MESVVGQAVGRQAVDIGCGDVCTEATQLGETGVVEQDDEHIRGSGRGAGPRGRHEPRLQLQLPRRRLDWPR